MFERVVAQDRFRRTGDRRGATVGHQNSVAGKDADRGFNWLGPVSVGARDASAVGYTALRQCSRLPSSADRRSFKSDYRLGGDGSK